MRRLLGSGLRFLISACIIFVCLMLGNLLSGLLLPALPGSILGLLLLTALLLAGVLRAEWVSPASDLLVRWMSLLFLPIGVGLVDQLDVLQQSWLGLLLVCIVGSLPLFWLCGYLVQKHMKAD
jgi:holin-like protein